MMVIVRGFIEGVKRFEDFIDLPDNTLDDDDLVTRIAERHTRWIMAQPGGETHMIELEFPDDPDPMQRFVRFGTDPGMMTMPIALDGKN